MCLAREQQQQQVSRASLKSPLSLNKSYIVRSFSLSFFSSSRRKLYFPSKNSTSSASHSKNMCTADSQEQDPYFITIFSILFLKYPDKIFISSPSPPLFFLLCSFFFLLAQDHLRPATFPSIRKLARRKANNATSEKSAGSDGIYVLGGSVELEIGYQIIRISCSTSTQLVYNRSCN